METKFNPHISVDCVIFGYEASNNSLKVLLLNRGNGDKPHSLKLPGSLIKESEDLDEAAYRVLRELTGLEDIFLQQLQSFGSPGRIDDPRDLEWFRKTYKVPVGRVVTIAYFALIKLNKKTMKPNTMEGAVWEEISQVGALAFDHNQILEKGMEHLRHKIRTTPIIFELLPKKFTFRQLQNLYEIILGHELDNRNFRKKIEKLDYLTPLDEKEKGVAHKPARLFKAKSRMKSQNKYRKDYLF